MKTQLATLPEVNVGVVGHIPAVPWKSAIEAQMPVDGLGVRLEEDDVDVLRGVGGTGAVQGIPDEVANDAGTKIRVGRASLTNRAKHLDEPRRAEDDALESRG